MGPYDGLVLTTGNEKSKYLKLNDISLASKKDLCVYQGSELPLDCNKTLYCRDHLLQVFQVMIKICLCFIEINLVPIAVHLLTLLLLVVYVQLKINVII